MNKKISQEGLLRRSAIATRIRTLRLSRTQLNQGDMADKLKMDRTNYNAMEKGRRPIGEPTMYQIAEVLGVSVEEIMEVLKTPLPPLTRSEERVSDPSRIVPPGLSEFLAKHHESITPKERWHLERSIFVVQDGVDLDEQFWIEQLEAWRRQLAIKGTR